MYNNKMKTLNLLNDRWMFWMVQVLAFAIIFILCPDLLIHLNQRLFATSGDGLQAYFTAAFHLKHDVDFFHFNGLNYPYGEQVFFTGCQPLITNSLKLIKPIIDLSPYIFGILNFLMLYSFALCAAYLFRIFRYFNVPQIWSVLYAISISFLSPQWDRLGGHLSLTYACAIPIYIFYLLKFNEQKSIGSSIKLALISFLFISTHLYFFIFFATLSLFFIVFSATEVAFKKRTLFLCIQILLPFLIFQSVNWIIDPVNDRPASPWGYLSFNSSFEGVFLTPNRFYSILYNWMNPKYPDWEGIAYVGFVSFIVFLGLFFGFLFRIFTLKWRILFRFFKDKRLNLLFISSIFLLIFSFGFPFKLIGGDQLLSYFGPIKQFRGVGRFSWLFFYVLAISVVVSLWQLSYIKKNIKNSLMIVVFLVFTYDVYVFQIDKITHFNNRFPEMTLNKLYSSSPFNTTISKKYQAIIPLPYFHNGSENIWIDPISTIKEKVYPLSLYTGIPITAVNLSRTSLSQTFNNLSLLNEPSQELGMLNACSKKPFLVAVIENEIGTKEKNMLEKCSFLFSYKGLDFYSLSVEDLLNERKNLEKNIQLDISENKWEKLQNFQQGDSNRIVHINHFNIKKWNPDFTFSFNMKNFNRIDSIFLKPFTDSVFTLSFWVKNIKKDLIPRTNVEIMYMDQSNKLIKADYVQFGQGLVHTLKNNGLVEFELNAPRSTRKVYITMWNQYFYKNEKLAIDLLILKHKKINLWTESQSLIWYNNRYLYKSKNLQ